MTHSNQTFINAGLLIAASSLVFFLPTWVMITTSIIGLSAWLLRSVAASHLPLKVIGRFCVEFLGFSLLVLLFVCSFVVMNGLFIG